MNAPILFAQSGSDDARKFYDQAMVSKRPTQKVHFLKKALAQSPNFVDARLELAITYYEAHEYEEAKAQFDTTLNYNAQNAFVWYHKGLTHRKLGEHESALKSLERAVKLREDIPQFHISLGEFYFDDGKYREALGAFDRAVAASLSEEDSEVAATAWFWKGQAHEAMRETKNALRSYKRALKLQPDFPSAQYAKKRLESQPTLVLWYQAADSAAAQESWSQSREYLQQIIEIDSTFKGATERLQWVDDRLKAKTLIDSALVLKKEKAALDSVFGVLRQARDLAPEKATYIDSLISSSERETGRLNKAKSSQQAASESQKSEEKKAGPITQIAPAGKGSEQVDSLVTTEVAGHKEVSSDKTVGEFVKTNRGPVAESDKSFPFFWVTVVTLVSGSVVFTFLLLKKKSRGITNYFGDTLTVPLSVSDKMLQGDRRDLEKKLRRYRLDKEIGEGGMGKVYKAFDTKLERTVALKTIRLEQAGNHREVEERIDRFRREAKATAKLNHPNIVSLYDYDEKDGMFYMTMEYVEGKPLQDLLKKGNLTVTESVQIALDVCKALEYAHSLRIVHRDIKPSNIILDANSNAKVLDFGIAKILKLSATQSNTMTGLRLGSPAYMSPEQIRSGILDGRSDIYSLGVVLYEMVSGQKTFDISEDDTVERLFYIILNESPKKLTTLNRKIPEQIEKIVEKMLAKELSMRYQNAKDVISDLSTALDSVEA